MDILIIGGTQFLGRALVEAAVESGHSVTMFNRGKTNPGAYPDIETIIGDRETDLDRLAGRRWDAVVDTCGYVPRVVRLSAEALADKVGHYSFISSISVYPIEGAPNRDEAAELLPLVDDAVEEITNDAYGPLKTACENVVLDAYPGSASIIRSGLIVGPHDPTNRFTYWVSRTARGGDAIAPPAGQPLQFVDVRDIADFTLHCAGAGIAGIYNVTGPAQRLTVGQLLTAAKATLDSDVEFRQVSDAFLQEREVGEWMELPLWMDGEHAEQFMTFNIDRALNAGLRFRPLETTIRDTYAWVNQLPEDVEWPAGLAPAREQALLAALGD